jgi:hypothetical protein
VYVAILKGSILLPTLNLTWQDANSVNAPNGENKMSIEEIKNHFESKCSIKIETNSRGYNTSIHVYQGVTEKEIDDTIFKAIYGMNGLQKELLTMEVLKK